MGRTEKNKQTSLDKYTMKDTEPEPSSSNVNSEVAQDTSMMSTILQEIRDTHSSLGAKMDNIVSRMDLMQNRVTKLGDRTTDVENRVGNSEDEMQRMGPMVHTLETTIKQ